MEDFPTQKITIYHKAENVWNRHVIEASYRNTSISNHNKSGVSSTDNALIRIFNIDEYNSKWFVQKDDVIVNTEVDDTIEGNTPLTQLTKKYGADNVHKITSIDKFIFDDVELPNHIKLGCI